MDVNSQGVQLVCLHRILVRVMTVCIILTGHMRGIEEETVNGSEIEIMGTHVPSMGNFRSRSPSCLPKIAFRRDAQVNCLMNESAALFLGLWSKDCLILHGVATTVHVRVHCMCMELTWRVIVKSYETYMYM